MSTPSTRRRNRAAAASGDGHGKIHPVVIYPFRQPADDTDLDELYGMIARLDADRETYARPITVMDRKTYFASTKNRRFMEFREDRVARHSDIIDAWCVDTCQMWNTGLGASFERGADGDVHWLIPGDFNYGSPVGREVLGRLHDLPEICIELGQDLCIGEILTNPSNPKDLIDTYGTFALLYNWFPDETREIRQFTERPRSEFFAIRHDFLGEVLRRRWFPYEQTVVILLDAVFGKKRITRFNVGGISDLPEGRESYAAAMQQVERTERLLRMVWRERHGPTAGWTGAYRQLDLQSEQIRRAALTVLEKLLL
ncbi:MAG: hypothetical protein HC841_04030 [Verrucomicrobiae bacterium]|nr:hypothetical protein [Verrucomicrobiae bacterium]